MIVFLHSSSHRLPFVRRYRYSPDRDSFKYYFLENRLSPYISMADSKFAFRAYFPLSSFYSAPQSISFEPAWMALWPSAIQPGHICLGKGAALAWTQFHSFPSAGICFAKLPEMYNKNKCQHIGKWKSNYPDKTMQCRTHIVFHSQLAST